MNFGNQVRAQKTAIISTPQEPMESLPEWHEISLSEVCIHSLEGAHALVSHPSLPPCLRSHWREFAIALCFYFA